MSLTKRLSLLIMTVCLLLNAPAAFAAKSKATPTPPPPEVPVEIQQEIPAEIQDVLNLAYSELMEVNGQELKKKNEYTKWRNNYEWGWCVGFVTWCMLQKEIPMLSRLDTPEKEVPGVVHVKEAGVGKVYEGYRKMNRLSMIPQKGFIAVYGNMEKKYGVSEFYHVGLVVDAELLNNGVYRITTIEGNVTLNFTDQNNERHKASHTVRMYTRDYHPDTEKKKDDLTLVPEEERNREESITFSYGYTYNNPKMYISYFLMPWIPGDPSLNLVPAEVPWDSQTTD